MGFWSLGWLADGIKVFLGVADFLGIKVSFGAADSLGIAVFLQAYWLLIGLLCRLGFGLALEMLLEKVQLQLLRFWPPLKVGCWADMKFGMAACSARALIKVK